jgi:hypothetical protein
MLAVTMMAMAITVMAAVVENFCFTANARTGDFEREVRRVDNDWDDSSKNIDDRTYRARNVYYFEDSDNSNLQALVNKIAIWLHRDGPSNARLRFTSKPVAVMMGWRDGVADKTMFDPNSGTISQGGFGFEVGSIFITANTRYLTAPIFSYKDNNNMLEGYKIAFTPSGSIFTSPAETRFTLQVNYRDGGRMQNERFDSGTFAIAVREAMTGNGAFHDGSKWVLEGGVVTREVATDLRGKNVQVGCFDTWKDFIEMSIPRYSQTDVVDWRWRALVTNGSEIASTVGFDSKKAIAAFRFRANTAVNADNITVSLRHDAVSDRTKTYNVYLIEQGESITTTVAGVKVTAAAEGIILGGEWQDTLTFPLVNRVLGTYVITTAPLINIEPEADNEDDEYEDDYDNDDIIIDIEDADRVSIPLTGGDTL